MLSKVETLIYDLIEISKNKYDYLKEIYRFTNKQSRFIRLERVEDLLKQIALRDQYMKKIDLLDLEFYKKYTELKKILGVDSLNEIKSMKYPKARELKIIVENIVKILEEIKTIDDDNRKKLNEDKNILKDKLKNVKKGKKVKAAYGAYKNQVKSVFFDKKK